MYIEKFSFHDKTTGWKIEDAQFGNLALLVGISGVGKTRILEAIKMLPRLARGESFSGVMWRVEFKDKENRSIIWEGETEAVAKGAGSQSAPGFVHCLVWKEEQRFPFLSESVFVAGNRLVYRENETSYFQEVATVKLAKDKSLLYLLKEEETIQPICASLREIHIHSTEDWISLNSAESHQKMTEKDLLVQQDCQKNNLKFCDVFEDIIKNIDMSQSQRFFLLESRNCEIVQKIKNDFYSIFKFVKELKYVKYASVSHEELAPDTQMYVLQLQEHGSDKWINPWDFSSGMLKTLSLLVSLHTAPIGSIFLIDEFENSFGVNCIDSVTDILLERIDSIQFIVTSHHPYIINKLPTKCWKLVTRKGSTVSLTPVEPLLSKVSKHEAFIQLVNLDEYIGGISQ